MTRNFGVIFTLYVTNSREYNNRIPHSTETPTVEPTANDVRARSNNITCDVINTVTRTEIPTVEPNANVDESSITVGNDSSNGTSIPALIGEIKTYSAVIIIIIIIIFI